MATAALEPQAPTPVPERRRSPWLHVGKWLLGIVAALALLLVAGVAFLDSGPGRRLIVDQIEKLAPASGLRIRVGRIEGSIFGRATLRDVRLYDTRGLFLYSPAIELDWRPAAYLYNELYIETLNADLVRLGRLPVFNPSQEDGPVLPDLDIHVGRLDIRRLELGREVTGEPRVGRIRGQADIRAGRALVDLQALVEGGDRLAVRLDADPDRDRFDLDARLLAPRGGVANALLGVNAPFELQVSGDGRWTQWNGTALLNWQGRRAANLALRNRAGAYELTGAVAPQAWLTGRPAALLGPRLLVNARGTFEDRRFDGALSVANPNLRGEARGVVDLAQSRFEGVDLAVRLIRPEVLIPTLRTEDLRLVAMLDGPFQRARVGFRLTEPALRFGDTGVRGLSIQGSGQLGSDPFRIPVSVRAAAVTGVGEVAGGLLTNVRIDGTLTWAGQAITSNDLAFRSDRLNGRATLLYDIRSGQYQLVLSGTLNRYQVNGLGIVDVTVSNVRVVNTPAGPRILGRARVVFRRLDNSFFRNLAGGLPVIDADFERLPNGFTYFRNARVRAPGLNLTGNGFLRPDGTVRFEGGGRSRQYGAFRLVLDGPISRPAVQLQLANPNIGGVQGIQLSLTPNARGFAFRASGQSPLGPFTAVGQIVLGAQTRFEITALQIAGTGVTARGVVTPVTGGLAGRLFISGGGLEGTLDLSVVGGRQRIEAHLAANNARFPGPPPILIREGRIDGAVVLNPDGPTAEGRVSLRGVQRGALTLSTLEATGNLRGGRGNVQATFAGRSGNQRFQFATTASFAQGRIEVNGQGTVNGRPARLTRPAVLVREGAGWRLLPATIAIEGGTATVAATFGGARTDISARLRNIRLSVLEIFAPDLGLGGVASGTIRFQDAAGDPTGNVSLRIRNLTRTGLVLASRPVDVGLAAVLGNGRLGARAVFNSGGQTIGRAQMLVRGYQGPGAFLDRLLRAPLQAQVRYAGAADTLWRLTGNDLIDLSGPISVGADVTGSLNNPQIRGGVRSETLRLESPITGTVLSNLQLRGTFGGSRLVLSTINGRTPGNGTVTGRGTFDLAAANGFGIDLALQATRARLLDRDDVAAAVTGPILIRSTGNGGVISGDLALDRGRFTLGRATGARAVPQLNIREVGRVADEDDIVLAGQPPLPWTLDLKVQGDNRLAVNGLGLDSEWGLDVGITGPVDAFRLNGRADFVRGGYEFAGKRFEITRGIIRFVGNSPPDPLLDIRAESNVQGLNAQVIVRGTGLAPEIAFTSTPALPQDELLSRLLFGTGIANLSAPEAIQLAAAVASLQGGGGGLDPIGAIRRAIGLDRLRIVPGDISNGNRTAIAAGKYITRRVYAEIVTDGAGYSATRVEYQISRFLSVLASISSRGRTGANVRWSRDY